MPSSGHPAMELLIGLFALLIPPAAAVAAVIAWQGLSQDDTHKLRLAAWLFAVPWVGVLLSGGPEGLALLFSAGLWSLAIVASLAVGAVVAFTWAWRRYQLRTTAPATMRSLKHGVDQAMQQPALLPTAATSDLSLPGLRVSAIAMTVVLAGVWLLAYPRGRSRSVSPVEAMQLLSFLGTLFMSAVATVCAAGFVFRRAPMLAAVYSASALCVVIGLVSLMTLAARDRGLEWRDLELVDGLPVVFIFLTITALIPAIVAGYRRVF